MEANILRKFYYIDNDTIDDYLSSIDGAISESEEVSERSTNNKGISGGISTPVLKANSGIKSVIEIETSKKVIQTYAGKFQKIYAYLEQSESILFYDNMDEQTWNSIQRNQFVELDVNLRFSKIDNLISSFSNLFPLLGKIDPSMFDNDSNKVFYIMNLFSETNKQKGIPAELNLINGSQFKFVSFFDHNCFVSNNLDSIPNEVTVLAKIQRKIKENEKINLINIVPMLENMAINREMRRSIKHSISELPEELLDNVKGPGAVIIPIAVYN